MNGVVQDLGRCGYLEAWEIQKQTAERVLAGDPDTLILVEHPPVLTLGAGFHEQNLLFTREQIHAQGVEVHVTDRGGDVTYHGPGQLVMYPIFDIGRHGKDLHKWLRDLEETQMVILTRLGLSGRRFPPHTGAWIRDKKVAAIGVKIRKWVSLHGIALNCSNDLKEFGLIVPCGIQEYGVTSLTRELGREVAVSDVKPMAIEAFSVVFGLNFVNAPKAG